MTSMFTFGHFIAAALFAFYLHLLAAVFLGWPVCRVGGSRKGNCEGKG